MEVREQPDELFLRLCIDARRHHTVKSRILHVHFRKRITTSTLSECVTSSNSCAADSTPPSPSPLRSPGSAACLLPCQKIEYQRVVRALRHECAYAEDPSDSPLSSHARPAAARSSISGDRCGLCLARLVKTKRGRARPVTRVFFLRALASRSTYSIKHRALTLLPCSTTSETYTNAAVK